MNKRMATKIQLFSLMLTFLFVAVQMHAENVRGEIAGTVICGRDAVEFRPEQLVVIRTDDVLDFQDGMEIRLKIPSGLSRYQNSFAILVFRGISPSPATGNAAYTGTRAFMRLLPSREATFIRIPFDAEHAIAGDALTDVLPAPVSPGQFPLILTVVPVAKGVPDLAFGEELSVDAVPIWKNKGALSVRITNQSGDPQEDIRILVDGTEIPMERETTLSAGIHRVRITSTLAPSIERTIALEPGQKLTLDIALDYRKPELTISVPPGVSVLLDGKPMEGTDAIRVISTEPGTHVVSYRLGELTVNRTFTLRPGSRVKVDLIVDIEIVDFGDSAGNEYGAGDG